MSFQHFSMIFLSMVPGWWGLRWWWWYDWKASFMSPVSPLGHFFSWADMVACSGEAAGSAVRVLRQQ